MPNIMSDNHNTRLTSTKCPCGACAGECKEGSVACILCNSWYHAGNCSGSPSSILMAMSKTSGLVWLCKSCETKGMERMLKGEKQIDTKAQETIVANVMQDKLDEIRDTNTKLIEDKLLLFQQNLEAKLENLLSEDRKSAQSWSEVTQRNAPLVKGLGTLKKETIENERLEQADQEKRKKNVIRHRVPESDKSEASARAGDDIKFFQQLTEDVLDIGDLKPTKAIRLGAKKTSKDSDGTTEERVSSRALKIVLPSKEDRDLLFRNLRKLRAADKSFASISVSYDLLQDLRKQIKLKIEEAKNKDGENAKNMYRMREPPNRLEVQKLKRKEKLSAESLDDAFVDNP